MGSGARFRAWAPPVVDVGVAVVAVVGVGVATVVAGDAQEAARHVDGWAMVLVVVAAATVAWRRRAPVVAVGVAVVATGVYLLAGYPYGPVLLSVVVGMFEVARQRGLRTSAVVCAGAVVVMTATTVYRLASQAELPALLVGLWTSWLLVPWSLGALVHVRVASVERARRELAARVALEERIRVAREVHDVAGHGFAVVAMQAGVALLVFDEQPAQARKSLEAIQTASTNALTELRSTLDAVARESAGPPTEVGLDGLPALVESVRGGGLPVRLDVDEAVTAIPDDVQHAAYRVVQEALTNVLRHAGPTQADVRLARDGDEIVVDVRDRGVGGAAEPGRGLAGMRTRVEAAGGILTTGPRDDGGFAVTARIPVEGAER